MGSQPSQMNLKLVVSNFSRLGGLSAAKLTDSIYDAIIALGTVQAAWNDSIVPLTSALPTKTGINPFVDGLDGAHMYVDSTATSGSWLYSDSNSRPKTIKEEFAALRLQITTEIENAIADLESSTSSASTPSDTTLDSFDSRISNNSRNITQVAKDLYDASSYSLDGDAAPNLTYSIRDHISALLAIHQGVWDSDLDLAHSGLTVSGQTEVPASEIYDSGFVGTPFTLEDDLNQLRTAVQRLRSPNGWTTPIGSLYSGGADSFDKLLTEGGTGTKAANNPWGYNWDDIDGLSSRLSTMVGFTGQADPADGTHSYSPTPTYFAPQDDHETAIGLLDSGLNAHVTNTSNPHTVTLSQANAAGGSVDAVNVTITDSGLYFSGNTVESGLQEAGAHIANISNPHSVTAAQVNIADNSGLFTSSTTEGALEEVGLELNNLTAYGDTWALSILDAHLDGVNIEEAGGGPFTNYYVAVPSGVDSSVYLRWSLSHAPDGAVLSGINLWLTLNNSNDLYALTVQKVATSTPAAPVNLFDNSGSPPSGPWNDNDLTSGVITHLLNTPTVIDKSSYDIVVKLGLYASSSGGGSYTDAGCFNAEAIWAPK